MASCLSPAKIMLAGEYAVVDGGPSVLMAADRHAVARVYEREQELSVFLAAALEAVGERFGADSAEAQAAARIAVDTSSFHEGAIKLGLGSSAAATVAAIGAALGARTGSPLNRSLVHQLATKAHGAAQASLGARGSGADIACCTFGGMLRFQRGEGDVAPRALVLPDGLHLVFPWTGRPASTAPLVAAVRDLRARDRKHYDRLCSDIATIADTIVAATSPAQVVEAIESGGHAVALLGRAAGVALWLPEHTEMATIARRHGGALKPTGAGGGDLALAAFADATRARAFRAELQAREIMCPDLGVDNEGVRLQA